jgi:conjugal transfer pilus assembly protein TrbC
MPRASLQLLTDQAARAGAVLVLRGLKSQSMRQTVAAVQELIGKRRVAWVIDPEAFTRFAVRQAPTFVLTLNDAASDMHSAAATPDAQRLPASSVWPAMSA